MPDISLIINFHDEKILAHQTLSCIGRMRKYAAEHGVSSEVVAVLDRPDPETEAVVCGHPVMLNDGRTIKVNNGDLGLSRNDGVSASKSEIVSIMDGDDYYSKNWAERSVFYIRYHGNKTIIHPEIVVSFGTVNNFCRQVDIEDDIYDPSGLMAYNYWASWTSSRKETYKDIPYCDIPKISSGFGYEDWHWNCETVAAGYEHRLGAKTVAFYRRKGKSMLVNYTQSNVTIRETALFSLENTNLLMRNM